MKILFLDNMIQISLGSNRIYIHNLKKWIKEIGFEVSYNKEDYDNYDIIICDKNFPIALAKEIMKKTKAIVGIANSSNPIIGEYDFCISACQTEKVYSLQYNKNIVLFPLIEILSGYKEHKEIDKITLCYHGNKEHLEQLDYPIIKALEDLSKKRLIKLKAIYNINDLGKWVHHRPNIEIEDVQWNFDTLAEDILSCEIGFIPNVSPITEMEKKWFFRFQKLFHIAKVGNDNDYLLRFKAHVNAGRAFVFHQLGLPIASDIYPDAYHILQSRNTGYLAHNYESWIHGLENLCKDAQHRQIIADNAKVEFDRLYDPLKLAENLIEDITKIKEESK